MTEETEDSSCTKLAGDEKQGPEKDQPPHDRGPRQPSPPQSAFDAIGLRGGEADGASSFVSSSEEEKESAGRRRLKACQWKPKVLVP